MRIKFIDRIIWSDTEKDILETARPADRLDDDALMRRVSARDSDALHSIADFYGDIPFRIGCRMLADPVEAEDIAQEALLRLWRYADRWAEGGPGIAAWLSRVAMNLCLDRLRKTRRDSDEDIPDSADEAPLADATMESDEVKQAVIDCIQSLPDRQRASVILTYYERLSNSHAADQLEMNIKAFESMLYRARGALAGCVEGKGLISADVERIHP